MFIFGNCGLSVYEDLIIESNNRSCPRCGKKEENGKELISFLRITRNLRCYLAKVFLCFLFELCFVRGKTSLFVRSRRSTVNYIGLGLSRLLYAKLLLLHTNLYTKVPLNTHKKCFCLLNVCFFLHTLSSQPLSI